MTAESRILKMLLSFYTVPRRGGSRVPHPYVKREPPPKSKSQEYGRRGGQVTALLMAKAGVSTWDISKKCGDVFKNTELGFSTTSAKNVVGSMLRMTDSRIQHVRSMTDAYAGTSSQGR